MDRRNVVLAIGKFAVITGVLVLGSSGCRSTRNEVPAGKPYQTSGNPPTVGFSTEPHPNLSQGMAGLVGNRGPGGLIADGSGSTGQSGSTVLGIPTQGNARLGAPSDHQYSAPGTSGTSGGPSIADSLLKSMPTTSEVLKKDPEAPPAIGAGPPSGYP
jgi:hypothetical protein